MASSCCTISSNISFLSFIFSFNRDCTFRSHNAASFSAASPALDSDGNYQMHCQSSYKKTSLHEERLSVQLLGLGSPDSQQCHQGLPALPKWLCGSCFEHFLNLLLLMVQLLPLAFWTRMALGWYPHLSNRQGIHDQCYSVLLINTLHDVTAERWSVTHMHSIFFEVFL